MIWNQFPIMRCPFKFHAPPSQLWHLSFAARSNLQTRQNITPRNRHVDSGWKARYPLRPPLIAQFPGSSVLPTDNMRYSERTTMIWSTENILAKEPIVTPLIRTPPTPMPILDFLSALLSRCPLSPQSPATILVIIALWYLPRSRGY